MYCPGEIHVKRGGFPISISTPCFVGPTVSGFHGKPVATSKIGAIASSNGISIPICAVRIRELDDEEIAWTQSFARVLRFY